MVDEPEVTDEEENACRLKLLDEFRGYRKDRDLFHSFPDDVSWHRYAISGPGLARVKYVDYSYWNELSGGLRLPADAARNVRAEFVVCGQSPQSFLDAARALERGARLREEIM